MKKITGKSRKGQNRPVVRRSVSDNVSRETLQAGLTALSDERCYMCQRFPRQNRNQLAVRTERESDEKPPGVRFSVKTRQNHAGAYQLQVDYLLMWNFRHPRLRSIPDYQTVIYVSHCQSGGAREVCRARIISLPHETHPSERHTALPANRGGSRGRVSVAAPGRHEQPLTDFCLPG